MSGLRGRDGVTEHLSRAGTITSGPGVRAVSKIVIPAKTATAHGAVITREGG
jgi:hypothetical protein